MDVTSLCFGFHGLPLSTFKMDLLDHGGVDLGKSDIIYSLHCSLKSQRVKAAYYMIIKYAKHGFTKSESPKL